MRKVGSSSTSSTQGTTRATDSPKSQEAPKTAATAPASQPSVHPMSDQAKAKAIGQKQQSGLLKRAAFDHALQSKGLSATSKLSSAERTERVYSQKSQELDAAKGKLEDAKKNADAARAELKAFPGLPGKLKALDQNIEKAQKEAAELEKKDPAFVKSQRKMWGGTEPERDLKDLKQTKDAIDKQIRQGDGPLKEKVKQAEAQEKGALHDFFGAAKELKQAVKDFAPYKKQENFERSKQLESQADKLRKEADFLHEKHPAVKVTYNTETTSGRTRNFGAMHSSAKQVTKHLPATVTKIHRTAEEEAAKVKDLKEADDLTGVARSKKEGAARLRDEALAWKKTQLHEISDLEKKYKKE